jgi:hypothetical protein
MNACVLCLVSFINCGSRNASTAGVRVHTITPGRRVCTSLMPAVHMQCVHVDMTVSVLPSFRTLCVLVTILVLSIMQGDFLPILLIRKSRI